MRCFRNRREARTDLTLAAMVACLAVAAMAQGPTYRLGRAPGAEEIRAIDRVDYAGKGLPPGSGASKDGAKLYAAKCVICHGENGEGTKLGPILVGKPGSTEGLRAWPFASPIWDIIYVAMPQNQRGSLTADQVYALTAFLLFRNGIIQENQVMDAQSLAKVQMPNRNGFLPSPWPNPDLKAFRARCPVSLCP